MDEDGRASGVVGGARGASAEWEASVGRARGAGEVGLGAGVMVRPGGAMLRRGAGGVACSSPAAHLLVGKRSLASGREPSETVAP